MQRLIPTLFMLVTLGGCQSARHDLPDACYQPPESGICRAAFQRYYYDADSGSCKSFIWGGCKGSVPFDTLQQCIDTCQASAADNTRNHSLETMNHE
ncbi:MAG: BPTI/Kunitz domain-containing protein [Alcanivorax sp.]|nr:BPTI/Kunitz domain-containing protein [Alcanivorax sp.]